jgi:hypothetical protein
LAVSSSVSNSNSERRCWRQVAAAESARSANRSPLWLRVRCESFRWMTGPQCAFGGVVGRLDAGVGDEGPQRGPDLEQVVGEAAVIAGAFAVAPGVLEQGSQR